MRLFTPEEANESLRVLRPRVERLVARRRELNGVAAEIDAVRTKVVGNGGHLNVARVNELQESAAAAAAEVAGLAEKLHELGVQIKDLDSGLVDFPAEHPESGETVLLCWRLGEDSVVHWHGLEEGFAGRKRLPF